MNKVLDKPVQIGENQTRYTMKVYDQNSEGPEVEVRLLAFLREFIDQPALLHCGPNFPQKMIIQYNGACWVLSAEAVSDG